MPFSLGIGEMVLVFLVVLLLTGGTRLPRIVAKLGEGVRQFRGSMREVGNELRTGTIEDLKSQLRADPPDPSWPEAPAARQHYGGAVRTVLARARTEAVRLQHPSVRTEHLLLALTLEPDGVTELVLLSFGVHLDQVRWRLKESLVLGAAPVDADIPYTGGAKRAIRSALEEAEALGHRRVDPVHLLLALLGERDGAGETLASLGVTLDGARLQADRELG
jgi:Sec-independent protein translocase protein TatA